MSVTEKAVFYKDDIGFSKPGQLYYPPALRPITQIIAELNRDDILHAASFNANILLYLEMIIGRFRSFHDTHRAAKEIYQAYRTQHRQYCLYLRSFSLGGIVLNSKMKGERGVENIGFSGQDRDFRKFLKTLLPSTFNCLSFINTFDLYPSGETPDKDYMNQVTIPSFRVLSHNWKEVVREVIRGANFIVLNIEGTTEGIGYELELLHESGLANRTIVVGRQQETSVPINAFQDVIDAREWRRELDNEHGGRLTQAIHGLTGDGFDQTNEVTDLSNLPCWVVDREIEHAARSFDPGVLASISYDLYIPSSLAGNWAGLMESYPKMFEQWKAIEDKMAQHQVVTTDELVKVLYSALRVFYLAVTIERYFEMSIALSTMGMAHRMITKNTGIMAGCYQHAAECAAWLGDTVLADFFADARLRLQQEIAANDH